MALRERKVVTCPDCKGTKLVNGKTCPKCGGEGKLVERLGEGGIPSQTRILNE